MSDQFDEIVLPPEASQPQDAQFDEVVSPGENAAQVHKASQIIQEVAAGKHPDMTEEELLPIMKVASQDSSGNQTTPSSRLVHQAGNVADVLLNPVKGYEVGKELVGQAGTGLKNLYGEVTDHPGKALADAVVGGAGKTLQFAGETIGNAATGTANLITQAVNSMTGKTVIDPDLTNTRSVIEQGQMNKGIEDTVRATGANPDSTAAEAGGLALQSLIPIGGEAKAAGAVAKTAEGLTEAAPKVAGTILEKGAQAGQNKYVQAAGLTATGHPVAGLGVLAERGLENRFGSLGGWLMNTRRKIMDATLGKVEGLGADLRAIPEGPYRDGLIQDAQSVVDKNNARLNSITAKEEIGPDAYVFQRHDDGSFVHPEEFLPKPEKEIRKIQTENDNQAVKIAQINHVNDFTKVSGYATKLGLATAGNVGVGSTIGGLIGGVNAQPGDDESAKRMAVMGAMISAPFAPFQASGALRDIRMEAGREAFKEAGKDSITPDHPNYEAHQEAYGKLDQQGKDTIDVANGMLKSMGGKSVIILHKEEFIKMQGGDASKAPGRGFVKDGNIYLNADKMASGVVHHELTHFLPQALGESAFDIMPDLKAKMEGKQTSQAYKDMESYYNSISPDASKTNIPEEVLAETGRRIMNDMPPELFYGGESGADVLKRWGGKILEKAAPSWYRENNIDPILKTPISKADEAAVRSKLFEIGSRNGQEPPRNAPDEPPATTIPPDPSKRATEPTVTSETPISAPPGAVEALTGLGEPKKSAQAKVDAATAEIQSEGVPVTLEEVVRRAVQKTVPTPIEPTLSSASQPLGSSESLSQAKAPNEGRSDAAKAPPAPAPIEEIPKQSPMIVPDSPTKKVPQSEDTAPNQRSALQNLSSSGDVNAQSEGASSQNAPSDVKNLLSNMGKGISDSFYDTAFASLKAGKDTISGVKDPLLPKAKPFYDAGLIKSPEDFKALVQSGDINKPVATRPLDTSLVASQKSQSISDNMLVGPRTDKYGKKSVSGRIFDPQNPDHIILADKAGLGSQDIAKLKELSDKMGETVGIDYSHAPEEGEGRKEAQKKTLAQARIEGAKREKLSKTFVPSWIEFTSGTGKAVVRGFSPDKFFENAKTVFDKYPEVMEGKYRDVNDPQLISDFQKYAQNHANGYTGMGKPIEGTELTPVKPNLNFEPNILPEDRASAINALMGDTSAAEGIRKPSPVKLEKRALARANAPFFDESVGETNKIRAKEGDMGLEPVSETLRPELIDKIREPNVADEHTIRPSGAAPESRASLAKAGTPNSTFSASGFFPDDFKGKTIEAGEEPWSIRLKELETREWNGGKLTDPEQKELLSLHKQAREEYGSYANWFEKMGAEKDYVSGVFGDEKQKQAFMPSEEEKDDMHHDKAESYFDIGQGQDDEMRHHDNWIYDPSSDSIKSKKGGTHGANFGHDVADKTFKGWHDTFQDKISVVFPDEAMAKLGLKSYETPKASEIPKNIRQKLEAKFGKHNEFVAFMPSPHIEREAERLGLQYKGTMGDSGQLLIFNDPVTKSTISIKADAEKGALQEKLKASREKFRASYATSFLPAPHVDTPEFKKWFSGSKVTDESGNPLPLYHGTTHDFSVFDPSRTNIENDFGKGLYFSNNPKDIEANYAGEGPDLTNRIERHAENLFDEKFVEAKSKKEIQGILDEYGLKLSDIPVKGYGSSPPEALVSIKHAASKAVAKKTLTSHGGATMKVYVKMDNPIELGGKKEPYWDMEYPQDESGDIDGEPTGKLVDFMDAIRHASSHYDDADPNPALVDYFDGGKPSEIIKALRDSSEFNMATDPETGDIASSEIIREALQRMGYDGIIDRTVDEKFGSQRRAGKQMEGMDADTVHYIAFSPEQIKSATGNRGTFDPHDPDVTHMPDSLAEVPEPKEPQNIKSLRVAQAPKKDDKQAPIDFKIGTKGSGYNTPLTAKEVIEFDKWKAKYAPKDSGKDYDLRGAFKAGLKPTNGHWPDTFKKPNHPTFSRESVYADESWVNRIPFNQVDSTGTGDSARKMEYFAPDDPDNPKPGKPTVEVFDSSMTAKDVSGELLSHYLSKVDKTVASIRQNILDVITDDQKKELRGDYDAAVKNGLVDKGDGFSDWLQKQGGDAFFRGFPTGQWPASVYTPEQKSLYRQLDKYLASDEFTAKKPARK